MGDSYRAASTAPNTKDRQMTTEDERAAEAARRERLRIADEAVREIDKDFNKNTKGKR